MNISQNTLQNVLKWGAVLVICKVGLSIVSNYVDYFPPNFHSEFLSGRKETFVGAYPIAFYMHILATPPVLVLGLVLISDRIRLRNRRLHRWLGRLQVGLVLLGVAPSGLVMAQQAMGGLVSVCGFVVLSVLTALFTTMGWLQATRMQFQSHRRWMLRSYVMLSSAVTLRIMGGVATVLQLESIDSYRFAAWASWLVPWLALEFWFRKSDQVRLAK